MMPAGLLFALGLCLLLVGAEGVVRAATRLAALLRIGPMIVGLTVVAFGTSTPELALGLQAAQEGKSDLVIGNVIGSNIANVLLILGLTALARPLSVSAQLVRLDVPLMIAFSLILWAMAGDGVIARWEGILLVAGGGAYTALLMRQGRPQPVRGAQAGSLARGWFWLALGILLLTLGARSMVDSATALAKGLGLSELIIGLTLLAVGTSLPELAIALVARWRGAADLTVGSIVGSNLYNIAWVLGLTSLIRDVPVSPAVVSFDLPVMLAVSVACLPVFFVGGQIRRWEGGMFLGYYFAYLAYLAFNARQHSFLPVYSQVMVAFVLPLTAITLLVLVLQEARGRRG